MLRYQSSVLVSIFSLLLLVAEIQCQRIRFGDGNQNNRSWRDRYSQSFPECDARSSCVRIRRCRILRNRPDWRSAGITCQSGYGESRMVCCPGRRTPLAATPSTLPFQTTPGPTIYRTNNEECGRSKTGRVKTPYIVGGIFAKEGAWPWMVAITRRGISGQYSLWCTGFLIDRKHVLSAAHCFDTRRDINLYSTRIGRINQTEGEVFPIVRITIPDGYRPGMYYDDIAILTLSREVDLPNFNPICLPDENISKKNLTGHGTTVAGWGAVKAKGELSNTLKQLSQMPIWSNQECNRVLRDVSSSFRRQFPLGINNAFLCAGFDEPGMDSCGGDSGGPLMIREGNKWYAIGIVSFGYSCGRPGVPGGYSRISQYLDFIRENTRD